MEEQKRKSKKHVFQAGTWFAIPIDQVSAFVVGRIYKWRDPIVLGRLYRRRWDHVPSCDELAQVSEADAAVWKLFSKMGLVAGGWPLICTVALPEGSSLPEPLFGFKGYHLQGAYMEVALDSQFMWVARREISREEYLTLPKYGYFPPAMVENEMGTSSV